MKRIYRAVAGFLVGVALLAALLWHRPVSEWSFVRRVIGFDFPSRTEYLALYDNGEWFVVSVVRLPEDAVAGFARQYGFTAHKSPGTIDSEALPEPYRQIPVRADVLSVDGQTEYQAWKATLDPRSRLLWIQIVYPDWGGTHSGTAPQPSSQSPP